MKKEFPQNHLQPHRTTINGIDTTILPLKETTAIKVELFIKAGSWYEKGDQWGAFHLLEHLLHQGTQKFPSSLQIEKYKEKHGLSSNASTGGDRTHFWVKGPYYSLKPALNFLSQLVFHPLLSASSLDKELSIIEHEYRDKWDNPHQRFSLKLNQQLYGKKHPYVRDGIGQPNFLETLSLEELKKLHHQYYSASQCLLTITGRLNQQKTQELVSDFFNPPTKQTSLPSIPQPSPIKKPITHHDTVQSANIELAWPLPGRNQTPIKDRLKINTLNYLLGDNPTSVLYQKIREKHALTYHTSSGWGLKPQLGYLSAGLTTDPENIDQALKLLEDTIYQFIENPPSSDRHQAAVAYLNASTFLNYDSIDKISSSLISNLYYRGRPYFPNDYLEITSQLTPQSTHHFVQKYLTQENQLTAFLKPKE